MVETLFYDQLTILEDTFEDLEDDVFVFPQSFAQERLWFLDQLEPGSPFYNIPAAVRLTGRLDLAALERTLNEIVQRHEILRTTFALVDGEPVQLIAPSLTLRLPVLDLRNLPQDEREAEALRLANVEARQPFDLSQGPLLRITLLQLDARDYVVLLTMHHIISDGWSMGVFIQELALLYDAFSSGRPSLLPELPIQYADFAHWQREWLQGDVLETQLDYWKGQLGGTPDALELPTDRPRPALQTGRGATQSLKLAGSLTEALKDLGRRERVTLFMTLLAAFQTLLHRYSGQDSISVGTPIANRNRGEIEGLIGFFVNTLVLRTDLAGDPTFRELLGRVREVTLGAYAHQDLPFETLVNALQLERDMSRSPLFQVMFILQNAPMKAQRLSDLTLHQMDVHSGTSTFDLTLSITEQTDGLSVAVEYNTDLFDAATVRRMLKRFETLLDGVAADPDQRVSQLPLLDEAERRQLLVGWNDTAIDYPQGRNRCVHQLFEAQVQRTPDAVAAVLPAIEAEQPLHLTYHELNRRANQLARYLRQQGVGPETLVGICVERSLEMVVGLLGILKAGGAYLPLDPTYPRERLTFMMQDSRVPVLLTQAHLTEKLPIQQTNQPTIVCLDTDWPQITQEDQENLDGVSPDNLAYVIYTSGSTGRPKGVLVPHGAVVNHNLATARQFRIESSDRVLQFATINFDTAVEELYPAWLSGATVVLRPNVPLAAGRDLLRLIEDEKLTVLDPPTAYWHTWVYEQSLSEEPLPESLRLVIVGGEKASRERFATWLEVGGKGVSWINTYGPTETTVIAALYEAVPEQGAGDELAELPIGRPIGNTKIYLLDRHLRPVPAGVPGELYIGGAGVARGYLNRPDLTAVRFVPDSFSDEPGGRLYKTGDLARYRPDGNVEFVGRVDYQVKVRGFRVEPGEVEAVLASHPVVREAAVLDWEVPTQNGHVAALDKRLVAYVAPADGSEPTIGELRHFLQTSLPDYMVPSAFVLLEALPLTPNNKVDRRALPAPDWTQRGTEREYVAPRTPSEEMLAGVWSRVLGLGQVGAHDNFFELGGHSLLATQLVSRVREAFGIDVPLRNVFEFPTLATMARQIDKIAKTAAGLVVPPIEPVSRDAGVELPLSFAQQRLWFLDQLEPGSPLYNIPDAVRIAGPLDVKALEWTLNEIVQRHEALHTTFATVDGKPVQIIRPELTLPLSLIDLSGLPETEREAQTLHLAQRAAQQPFDLARGPLLRTWLLRLSEQEHIFALTMHHVISDNWSTGILIQEVAMLYDAFSNRRPLSLPKLPIQYADFAHWQRNWLQGEVLETQLDYWKGQLAGQPPLLELPTDRPRPAVQTFRGDYQSFVLSEDLSKAIEALCQREGVTLFMTLLAAFQTLLYRYSGQDDVSVGTPIANRSWAEVEGLIGFFVNTLVLRTDLSGAPSFRELLERVRETALGAYAHQDVPFEMIVDVLQPQRNLSHSPLFQVMFALQSSQAQTQSLPGSALTLSAVEAHSGTAKFDLTLFMVQDGEQLGGALEYNTDLFDAPTIARMLGHFELLLAGIVADPDHPISALPLLAEAERRRMLVEWNDTAAPYPRDLCVQQLFEAQVVRTPEAVAVAFAEQHLTFAALNRRANQLAHYLQKQGVGPDTLVGMCVERSLEMVVGLLGVLKAGGAYVPLDPTYPPERLAFMLQDSQVPVLLTQAQLVDRLPIQQTNKQTIQPNLVCLDADWSLVAQESDATPPNAATPDGLAYVIYTSGSTGLPKGAMIRHQGLVNYLTWCQHAYPVQAGRGAPVHSSISFDLTVTGLFAPLLAGRRVQILPEDVGVETLSTALQQEQDYSLVKITPAHLELLSQQLSPQEAAGRTRAFIIGGENLLAESVAFWQKYAPDTLLVNEYGPTETVVGCCVYKVSPDESRPGSVPIGQPIINTQLYILDPRLSPLPAGAIGELYIGGDGVARGYLNRPELTAAKFVPDPFGREAGARLYKTGDLARYLPGGDIEFLGRTDHQVKVRGFRIELGEIEAVLSQHAAVQETIVLAREDIPGDKRLVAYVVTTDDDGDWRGYLKDRLPEYMVPSAFVTLDALPLTTNGKVDRRALPVPDWTRPELGATFVAPRTPEEEILAGIWAGILGVERVGVYDTFFDLGGHSLLATQVISRLRDAFDVELPVRALFEAPTVAGLAASVEAARREAQGLSAPPIEPLPRDAGLELPLSFAQQRLWFLDQLEPGSPFYNLPTAVRLTGPLDVVALAQSLNEVVRRHEALRTTFASVEGRPLQVIAAQMTLALPVVDLTALEERQVEAQRLATAEARRPFDLAQGSLLRACLLRLEDSEHSEHVVLLNMHHIVSDGWSMNVLVQELAAHYVAFSSGDVSPTAGRKQALLPELPIQYADFAHWQRNWLQGEVLEAQLAYWKEQLAGLPPLLELPTDRPRPAVQTFRGAQKTFVLPPELSTALKDLSYAENATLFMTLLAAFQTLLSRYTGQKDISVGTPIANRNRSAIEGLIGFFVNTLVMRADLTGAPSFRELLGQVREAALGAYAHQDVPFEMLVDVLQPQRDMSHSPLFQVMFVLQNTPTQAQALSSDLVLSAVEADEGTARFDLTLTMVEDAQGLGGFIEYNVDLFDAVTVERLIAHFQTLLAGIVADPDLCVARLPLLTGAERQQLLATWNDTAASDSRAQDQCAHELFEAQVARTPDAVAVVFDDLALTYQALNRRANQLAHHLQKLGVGAETLVGISVQRSPDMVVGLLGILKAGGVYLPLDPTYPQNRLSFMLEDAQVSILLTQAQLDPISNLQSLAPARSAGDPIPNTVRLDADWARIAQESDANPTGNVTPENLAYVIYTSGSTGRPKGALLRHRGLCNLVRAAIPIFGVGADSRVLQFASFSFDASVEEIFKTLSAGASLCLIRQEMLLSPPDLLRTLREQAITTVTLPPSLLKVLPAEGLPALQTVVSAGESCSPDVVARWAPGRRFLNGYGPTEATVAVSFYRVERVSEEMTYVSIGRPLANAQIYLLDAQLQPVPVGVPGELHIGGVGLARGYLRRPGLTAAKFIPNPFGNEPGKQLYGTGDLARHRPDGRIEFLGRLDHQVKVRGFRIELGEIEALLQQHPALQAAAVLAREGDGQGPSGDKRLVAYVVPTAGQGDATVVVGELRSFLLDSLPEYMVPAAFVTLDALPLTPNGKVDRRVLPAPDLARSELEKTFVAPRDELERQVTQIWEQVLGVQPIGVKDNFFELGGHSLLAVQLVAQIQQHIGQNVSLLALFQSPTIEHLVRVLRRQSGTAPAPSLVELQPAGHRRPFFLVHPSGGSVHWYTGLAHLVGGPPQRRVRRLLNAFGRVLRRRTAHKPPQPAEGVVRAEDSRLDQPVYGLQAQGLMGDAELHTRIEDMAAHYVQELRAVQPEGPYMLGSWSMGVIIAFEMAQQLEAQGQRVALLALLDQGPVVPGEPFPDDAAFLMRLFGEHLALSPERLRQLGPDEQLAYVFEEAGKANWLPTGITLPQFSHYVRILRLHTEAWREYVPQVYPGRVTLFRTQAQPEIGSQEPDLGWGELAAGGIEIHQVSGDHHSIVHGRHVWNLAECLRACLDAAQAVD